MKKMLLLTALMAVFIGCSTKIASADGSWASPTDMGTVVDFDQVLYPQTYQDFMGSQIYLAYINTATNKVSVKSSYISWTLVGNANFSRGVATKVKLAFDTNTQIPYVAVLIQDAPQTQSIDVYKLNGSTWEQVGATITSVGSMFSLAIDPSTHHPYVAYDDSTPAILGQLVIKNFDGSDWQLSGSGISDGAIASISMAMEPSTHAPYVAFVDSLALYPTLKVYSLSASTWSQVGTSLSASVNNPSIQLVFKKSLQIPAVVFKQTDTLDRVVVYEFNPGTWTKIGSDVLTAAIGSDAFGQLSLDYYTRSDSPFVGILASDGSKNGIVRKFSFSSWYTVADTGLVSDSLINFKMLVSDYGEQAQVAYLRASDSKLLLSHYVPSGSYRVSSSSSPLTLTCERGQSCQYSSAVTFTNDTGYRLYNSMLWTTDHNYLQFEGFTGGLTNDSSQTTGFVEPDYPVITTVVNINPPAAIGSYFYSLAADGQTCNTNTDPWDCIWGSSGVFQAHIIVQDTIAPTVALSYSPVSPVKAGPITITATYSENIIDSDTPSITINQPGTADTTAPMTYVGDRAHWTYSYTVHPHTDAGYADGAAAVSLSTVHDVGGNPAAAPTGNSFIIDTTPPVVHVVTPNANPAQSKTVTANITNETGTLTMKELANISQPCDGDTGFRPYSPITFSSEADNEKVVCYRAVDLAGNVTTLYPHSLAIGGIDTTSPTVALSYNPSSPVTAGTVTITATYSENVNNSDTPHITINQPGTTDDSGDMTVGSDRQHWTYAYTVHAASGTAYADGTATVILSTVQDAAGNSAAGPTNASFDIDTIAPTITVTNPNSNPAQSKTVTASAPGAAVFNMKVLAHLSDACDGNSGYVAYASKTFTTEADNNKAMCYWAQDGLGNSSYQKSATPISGIDRTPPGGSIQYSPPDNTAGSVTATLTPSETSTITNNNGSNVYVFTQNGSFDFHLMDTAGNTSIVTATVSSIISASQVKAWNFVKRMYTRALGRDADSTGVNYWFNRLIAGQSTKLQIIDAYIRTDEYYRNYVRGIYHEFMNRDADQSGLDYWTNRMLNGLSKTNLIGSFAYSQEYLGQSNNAFVASLYQDFMNRTPDPAGVGYWVAQLSSGAKTKQGVIRDFFNSYEFNAKYVQEQYQQILARGTDSSGEQYWVGQLQRGLDRMKLTSNLLDSDEFWNK